MTPAPTTDNAGPLSAPAPRRGAPSPLAAFATFAAGLGPALAEDRAGTKRNAAPSRR